MMLLDQDLESIRAGPTTRALPFPAPREPDPQGLGKGRLGIVTSSPSHRSGENGQDSRPQVCLARFHQHPSAGLPLRRGNKLPPRVLQRLKRLERADSSRVPSRTCSLRESPSVSRPLVRVVRVDPALLAGLLLSADPPYLPTSSGQRSARTKWATAYSRYACCRWTGCHTPRRPKIKKHTI